MNEDDVRSTVRETYAKAARSGPSGCGCSPGTSCCGAAPSAGEVSSRLGYSAEELAAAPEGANLGLGCGNPQAIAGLREGETVLDLGSGGGFDCFLAARQVGDGGRVIGVDMTPEMVVRARENARNGGFTNVEFRLGEIEHLPVADASVDVVISNCVVNLSPDKPGVVADMFRALKPGGRVAISDIIATAPMPKEMKNDVAMLSGCVSGAATTEELRAMLETVGFADISITPDERSREVVASFAPGRGVEDYVVSASIEARKPA